LACLISPGGQAGHREREISLSFHLLGVLFYLNEIIGFINYRDINKDHEENIVFGLAAKNKSDKNHCMISCDDFNLVMNMKMR